MLRLSFGLGCSLDFRLGFQLRFRLNLCLGLKLRLCLGLTVGLGSGIGWLSLVAGSASMTVGPSVVSSGSVTAAGGGTAPEEAPAAAGCPDGRPVGFAVGFRAGEGLRAPVPGLVGILRWGFFAGPGSGTFSTVPTYQRSGDPLSLHHECATSRAFS